MILENENTFLGGLMADAKRIAGVLIGVGVLTAFIGFLIAPMLEPLICQDLYGRATLGTEEEMSLAKRQIKTTRRFLWFICMISWVITVLILSGYNLYNY